ncbi:MAG: hypothetical protein HY782_05155 [Chloroflexi bacterium]|nr:hypothetical protein [Chloroflexota bacterium]
MPKPIPNPLDFFSTYMRLTGAAHLGPEQHGDPRLLGKRLGLLNGSSWVTAWSNYFGRLLLPGVTLVNAGNDAVQLNFMQAYADHAPCPPGANIERFVAYARDLVELANVDAVLITCSTMNRSYVHVADALAPFNVPVVQIDMPMMEAAVTRGGKVLVIATHGPTVTSTQALLDETATRLGMSVAYDGATVESAWHRLAEGDIAGHNQLLADAIRDQLGRNSYSSVVLAQLSMSAFLFSYPDPASILGLPVFTSGQCGFERMRDVLLS